MTNDNFGWDAALDKEGKRRRRKEKGERRKVKGER
jgi:hypothetical protein